MVHYVLDRMSQLCMLVHDDDDESWAQAMRDESSHGLSDCESYTIWNMQNVYGSSRFIHQRREQLINACRRVFNADVHIAVKI